MLIKCPCFRIRRPKRYFMVILKRGFREQLAEYFEHYFDEDGKEPENKYAKYASVIKSSKDCKTILIPSSTSWNLFQKLDQKKIEEERKSSNDVYEYPLPSSSLSSLLSNYCGWTFREYSSEKETLKEMFYGEDKGRTTRALIFKADDKGNITGYEEKDLEKFLENGELERGVNGFDDSEFGFPILFFEKPEKRMRI